MEHTHEDPHYHLSTCTRCERDWDVRRATDPLWVEPTVLEVRVANVPPILTNRWVNLFVPLNLRVAALALWWKVTGQRP